MPAQDASVLGLLRRLGGPADDEPDAELLGRFGKEVGPFDGGWVLTVAFSPDGRSLVSGGLDRMAHVWDVSGITERRPDAAERSAAELEADWKDLAGDAAAGYAALGRLISSPGRAVPFLGKQLRGTDPALTKRVEGLIAGLDHEQFAAREQATKELRELGDLAAPALRKSLAGGPSPEATQRIGALLDRLEGAAPSAETARQLRAVAALELIGTAEARRLLDQLASGPPGMRATEEAKASADRLAKRLPGRP